MKKYNEESIWDIEEKETNERDNDQEEKTTIQEESNSRGDQCLRRSERHNKDIQPNRYCNLAHYSGEVIFEPDTYEEAMPSSHNTQWIKGMENEYESLIKANTWTLVDKPINKNIVGCKWIYKA